MKYTIKIALQAFAICTSPLFAGQQGEIPSDQAYPRLRNIYHSNSDHMNYLRIVVSQLRQGRLSRHRFPILLHGPSGTGKTATVSALINEARCFCVKTDGARILTEAHRDPAENIRNLFTLAHALRNQNKGVLVFIDNMEGLLRDSTNSSQRELSSQLSIYRQSSEHDHICFVATSNEFGPLSSELRNQFKCIKLDEPNYETMKKILADKAQYLNLNVRAALGYHDRIYRWNTRNVVNFLIKAAHYVEVMRKSQQAALQLAYTEEANTIAQALWENRMNTCKKYAWEGGKQIALHLLTSYALPNILSKKISTTPLSVSTPSATEGLLEVGRRAIAETRAAGLENTIHQYLSDIGLPSSLQNKLVTIIFPE